MLRRPIFLTVVLIAATFVVWPQRAHPGAVEEGPCVAESVYEQGTGYGINSYGSDCRRLKYVYGPVTVRPGQNDATIEPVVIQKPTREGYMVRFKAGIIEPAGEVLGTQGLHLHHAVWLSSATQDDYLRFGNFSGGPIIATGEERTIATFPTGYGMLIRPYDVWALLYMMMNMTTTPREVFITYEIDFVEKPAGDRLGIVPIKTVWLDVQRTQVHPEAPERSAYPVFNIQRGFGHHDQETGSLVCAWPRENCARHDAYGALTPNQGRTVDGAGRPIEIAGADYRIPKAYEGTLVWIGGHLHPGGLRDEVSLVRSGVEKPIFISDAAYWKGEVAGTEPNAWDFSMTVTGASLGWKVKVKEGDVLRINATYDSQSASWYEVMGIVVAMVAPSDPHGFRGIDVFEEDLVFNRGFPKTGVLASGMNASCEPSLDGSPKTLCLRGQVTRGSDGGHHVHGSGAHPDGDGSDDGHSYKEGPWVSDLAIQGFSYANADLRNVGLLGVPRIELGKTITFWNLDTGAKISHTVTSCKTPCDQPDIPMADGGSGDASDVMDFDSGQLGYGLFYDGAKGQFPPQKPIDTTLRDGIMWQFEPTRPGVFTFFCRNHPFMRGMIEVVGPTAAPSHDHGGEPEGEHPGHSDQDPPASTGHDHESGTNPSGTNPSGTNPSGTNPSSHDGHTQAIGDGTAQAHDDGALSHSEGEGHAGGAEETAEGTGQTHGTSSGGHSGHMGIALAFVALGGAAAALAFLGRRPLFARLAAGALALQLAGLGWDMVLHAAAAEPLDLFENPGHIVAGFGIALLSLVVALPSLPTRLLARLGSGVAPEPAPAPGGPEEPEGTVEELHRKRRSA